MIPYTANSGFTQNRFSWGATTLGTVKSVSSPTNINAQFAIKLKLVNGEYSVKERKVYRHERLFFKENKPQRQIFTVKMYNYKFFVFFVRAIRQCFL